MSDYQPYSGGNDPSWSNQPPVNPNGPTGPRASFGSRFGAWIIDFIIVGVVSFILGALLKGPGSVLGLVFDIGYVVYFFGAERGQTPGYMATGIRVISADGRGAIGYGRSTVRWLVSLISAWAILIGYLWMLWDREKQTWFDKASNSVVVPVSAYPVE
jgi:uncharacterized RDD family membrane protein YckC